MKENGKANRGFIFKREQNFRSRFLAEQNFGEALFGRSDFIRRAFVGRERTDQFENDWNIADRRRTNCEIVLFHFETGSNL